MIFSGSGMAKEWFTETCSLNFSQWQEVHKRCHFELHKKAQNQEFILPERMM
ncbi:hypothetical protein [Bacteroidetes bacterium endosymbiont of Geopemphigus sp.]|uniref:hypothetical protein n=1 Tax=Bacteroidetes bacterium endosymbiont of Geopemphigus sp. TaxID=2047937 RepID=UPI0022434277|nr:hypothetical protein [Bacteroidetes bacterium endosymbiont of Geopemphigus sp.]